MGRESRGKKLYYCETNPIWLGRNCTLNLLSDRDIESAALRRLLGLVFGAGICGTTTNSAAITITNDMAITSQPVSQTACLGQMVTFSVGATGNSLSYQWWFNGVPLTTNKSHIFGCTTANLTVSNVFATTLVCLPVLSDNGAGTGFEYLVTGDTYTYQASGCALVSDGLYADPNGNTYSDSNCTEFVDGPGPARAAYSCPGLVAYSLAAIIGSDSCIQFGTNGSFQAQGPYYLSLHLNDHNRQHNSGSWNACITHTVEGVYDCIVSSSCGSQISTVATLSVATDCAVIPTNRLIDWTQAGVPGGVPDTSSWPTSAVMNTGTMEAYIQSALDTAASNSIVLLNAGTYTINTELFVRKTGVVLKGAGPNNTMLSITNPIDSGHETSGIAVNLGLEGIIFPSANTDTCGSPTTPFSNNWVAGFSQGNTVIYVAANSTTQGLATGMIIGLDQLDDGVNVFPGSEKTDNSYARGCALRSLQEFKQVVNVVTNQVTIYPGLYSPFWSIAQTPAIFWPSTNVSDYISLAGIEGITINGNGLPKYALNFGPTFNCWSKNLIVSNVAETGTGAAQVGTSFAVHDELRHSILTPSPTPSSSGNYVFSPHNSADFRFEDNIIGGALGYYNAHLIYQCSGFVFAFNYYTNDLDQATLGNSGCGCSGPTINFGAHGGQVFDMLVEGNYVRHKAFYNNNGFEQYGTVFRNRITGQEKTTDSDPHNSGFRVIRLMENSYYESIVGNVLGETNYATPYEGATGGDAIYCTAGTNGDFTSGGPGDVDFDDPKVTNTLFRAGNWDSVNTAVVWSSASPQPITNSLAYASKPSWWPSSRPWPPYDPNLSSSASWSNIPAGYRFTTGSDPP